MKNKITFSNILILVSIIFTTIWYFDPKFIQEWWINNFYKQNILHYFFQFFSWSFIHWWITHLFMNSIFIYYFWNQLEEYIWRKKYIIFFISCIIFLWFIITKTTNHNTIWISWFAMALLSYYTILLYHLKNPEYKWWITAIIINIWIWIIPWISLIWHAWWTIYGIIFYLITKKTKINS
jgi:membrane associated rhomboid family serine protease